MPKSFQEILPALEQRLEQTQAGSLPHGHAMELRRREKRRAMGCPSDEEIGGFVDGQLKAFSKARWTEVQWHIRQCQYCQDDVEGLCEALELDLHDVAMASKPSRQRLFRYAAPFAAAAVLVLAVLGFGGYLPAFVDKTPPVADRQQPAEPQAAGTLSFSPAPESDSPAMKVSIPSNAGSEVSPVLRVALCSETERPTCKDGMKRISVMGAACRVTGDYNSCSAQGAAGGCAICLVSK